MRLTQTHTYVIMELSQNAYIEILGKMRKAYPEREFPDYGEIDMHGIAVCMEFAKKARKQKYQIATGAGPRELEMVVNEYMEDGYVPQGGVSRAELDEESYFAQAMILPT